MTELSGSLDAVPLGPLLGLLNQLKKNGRLHISEEGWGGELFLRDGQVVAASFGVARGLGGVPSGTLRGLVALEAVALVLSHGGFILLEGVPTTEYSITLSAEDLRAHLTVLEEERLASGATLPPLVAIPRRVDPTEQPSPDEQFLIDRGKLNLLLATDGHRTVAELIGEQGLLRTFRDLRWLADQHLISWADVSASGPRTAANGHVEHARRSS